MQKKLFLLDGMALVYRAHFALINRPIFNSKGINTSALYGFTQTLLDILSSRQPTHIAVAFDTSAPTERHQIFPDYKIQREEMPEDITAALPEVRRLLEALRIPVLTSDGYEADDIIGTLVCRAKKDDFETYMVTPDKDFGQLVSENTFLYKPSRMGEGIEILGVPEILKKWDINDPKQVIDILALWGDSVDNIPGVPGVGEKTASKLIRQFGSVEGIYEHLPEVKGKLQETLATHREAALMSKKLATINCESPVEVDWELFKLKPRDDEKLKALFVEFEFNSIGKRLFGDDFRAGRGHAGPGTPAPATEDASEPPAEGTSSSAPAIAANLATLETSPHEYRTISSKAELRKVLDALQGAPAFAVEVLCQDDDARAATPCGLAFSAKPHEAYFIPGALLNEVRPLIAQSGAVKIGHDLKRTMRLFRNGGLDLAGPFFDVVLAHTLMEPDMRHHLEYLAEAHLGYTPSKVVQTGPGQLTLSLEPSEHLVTIACETADLALRLHQALEPKLKERGLETVFHQIEAPLAPVLVSMESEGVRLDAKVLSEFGLQLGNEISTQEKAIYQLARREFNLNSPKQLGEILFEDLKLVDVPKKTKTGQYATNEQTLQTLAAEHEIVRRILEYRAASKLKSTYVDALPSTIWSRSGRVHTTYNQALTATGRLQSENPNLQNIPIRTEQGREIRKAFIPRNADHFLLAADYSQIELRIIAALSGEEAMIEAFRNGLDIHVATAARVYNVMLELVTSDMRRTAKMVNFGIIYGISAFGLSQRLGIPRKEAAAIIEQYFKQYPHIQGYMNETIEFARQHGYVQTVTGRRRYLRDIRSSNATIRAAAERTAINAPIQGTAADMIKIAMIQIHADMAARNLKSRMILQVHDELVFDLYKPEESELRQIIENRMKNAISLPVPIEVEIGLGENWLDAH